MALESNGSACAAALRAEIERVVREAAAADIPLNAGREARRVALKFPGIHTYAELADMFIRASAGFGGSAIEMGDDGKPSG